jgi:hypothetical protein
MKAGYTETPIWAVNVSIIAGPDTNELRLSLFRAAEG